MTHETFAAFMIWLMTKPEEHHMAIMRAKIEEMYRERNGTPSRFVFVDSEESFLDPAVVE